MSLTFAEGWHPLVVIVVCLLLAAAVYRFYKKNYLVLPRGRGVLLLSLKIAAVIFLLMCIFKPVLSYQSGSSEANRLLVLVDNSESMSIKDSIGGASRLDAAKKILFDGKSGIVSPLGKTFETQTYSFSSSPQLLTGDAPLKLAADGKATAITKCIAEASSRSGRNPPAAVLIVSDGSDNSGQESRITGNFPIFTIGVGTHVSKAEGFKDIAVGLGSVPESAFKNTTVEVSVEVKNRNFPAETSVPLSLKCLDRQGEMVTAANAKFSKTQETQKIVLSFVPQETGVFEYEVSIPVQQGEFLKENNTASFTLHVLETKLKVLLIDSARWEYKFIKQVLEEDQNVEFMGAVMTVSNQFTLQGKGDASIIAHGIPESDDALARFDVIMLGDIPRTAFADSQLEALKKYVANGGALVALGGESGLGTGGYGGTPVEKILPVSLGGKSAGQVKGEFIPHLTAEGRTHPIFAGCEKFFASVAEVSCPLKSVTRVGKAKPGAVVLLEHPAAATESGNLPVVAVQQFGEGKTMVVAADGTWNWHFKHKGLGLNSPHVKFWGQAVRWLSDKRGESTDESPLSLWTNKRNYSQDEKVTILARVDETRAKLESADSLSVKITLPSGQSVSEFLKKEKDSRELKTSYQPPTDGRYEVSASIVDSKNQSVEKKSLFVVGRKYVEFEDPDLNEILLQKLSSETKGKYYNVPEASNAVSDIENVMVTASERKEFSIWDTPLFFLIFVFLLTAEWIIRKRSMLV